MNHTLPKNAAAIITTFSTTGAAAAGPNLRWTCRIAPRNATPQTIGMYGSISIVSRSAAIALTPSACDSNTCRTTSPTTVIPANNIATTTTHSDANRRASAGSSLSSFVYRGIKAAVNAPSPNSRRNRFGTMNPIKNASSTIDAPNVAANTASRTKPNTRDTNVNPLTNAACPINPPPESPPPRNFPRLLRE